MRYMILAKATPQTEAGVMPEEKLVARVADYHEQLARAGVLLDAAALQPSAKGWRVRDAGGQRTLARGPFAECKQLVAGYTLIEVRSTEEALEWTRRYPATMDGAAAGEIDLRECVSRSSGA